MPEPIPYVADLIDPLVGFNSISLADLNICLVQWGHKMGALDRPSFAPDRAYGLFTEGRIVGVVAQLNMFGNECEGMCGV